MHLLTTTEVAVRLRVSPARVRQLRNSSVLREASVVPGGPAGQPMVYLFDAGAVERLRRKREQEEPQRPAFELFELS